MPLKKSERLLRFLRRYVHEDGLILYNATTKVMLEEDPLTDFIMRIAGWDMDYKTEEEIAGLAVGGGWKPLYSFSDDKGFNMMVVASVM